jgi:aminoglycoside 6'-N-acetyltransferase
VVRGALTTLRGATDADAELLVEWHADPEVSRYWDGETFTREQMLQRLRRPDVDAFIVEADGVPVGYVQAWREGDAGGIDMFMIPVARGRGLGPDAGRALARHLNEVRGWTRVTVDPYAWNDAAIRAWRKAGFAEVERRPPDGEHSAPWLLMVWEG